jgi:hypothetical protein
MRMTLAILRSRTWTMGINSNVMTHSKKLPVTIPQLSLKLHNIHRSTTTMSYYLAKGILTIANTYERSTQQQ